MVHELISSGRTACNDHPLCLATLQHVPNVLILVIPRLFINLKKRFGWLGHLLRDSMLLLTWELLQGHGPTVLQADQGLQEPEFKINGSFS